MNKLKQYLTNTWMNNADVLAQIGHFLGGYALVLTVAYFSNTNYWWILGFTGGLVVYAAVKEFWYDKNFEIPKQTWQDNTLDFSMYCVGLLFGWLIVGIKIWAK